MPDLRETVAEVMRLCRLNDAAGTWEQQNETTKDEWRLSAAKLIVLLRASGVVIRFGE